MSTFFCSQALTRPEGVPCTSCGALLFQTACSSCVFLSSQHVAFSPVASSVSFLPSYTSTPIGIRAPRYSFVSVSFPAPYCSLSHMIIVIPFNCGCSLPPFHILRFCFFCPFRLPVFTDPFPTDGVLNPNGIVPVNNNNNSDGNIDAPKLQPNPPVQEAKNAPIGGEKKAPRTCFDSRLFTTEVRLSHSELDFLVYFIVKINVNSNSC